MQTVTRETFEPAAITPVRDLLYVSPVFPACTGNGVTMRSGAVLQMLAWRYRVSLLVVPLYGPGAVSDPTELVPLCHRVVEQPAWQMSAIPEPLQEARFDVVHLVSLAVLPFAEPYLVRDSAHTPRRHLDLYDIESLAHRRIAALYHQNGNPAMAQYEEQLAQQAWGQEERVLRSFDRIYVCSTVDREELRDRSSAEIVVLPNTVRLPKPAPPRRPDSSFTFLFVGTLSYYPNEDALRFFCSEVLPILRRFAPQEFNLSVVGIGATAALQDVASTPEVRLIGAVPDVAPYYREADAVVVPIRAGGGTRIKILEAFSHCRPVVSTSLGMEGIEVRDEEQALIADTAEDFARQCARLMADAGLRERLAEHALALVSRAYTVEAAARSLAHPV